MKNQSTSKINDLLLKGVRIPNPDTVEIGSEVDADRISGDGVVIYSGCKIYGNSTHILHGAKLGYEGPVTIENCQLGPMVELKGGFFKDSVFLKKASAGLGAHVRQGTILEEESSIAHTVGLKQTILFPYVTLGSLINFCDCLMAGGTSRKDHSEVGSSYIHFNYTPNQDKATPSLIGDVAQGVMLNQRPIFLGGQGGLVGPCRLAYGTVIAAGSIYRKDEFRPGRLLFEGKGKGGSIPITPGLYRSVKRVVVNNVIYVANLMALMQWYSHVRAAFISTDFTEAISDGLQEKLRDGIAERVKRLEKLSEKMPESVGIYREIAKEKASPRLLLQKQELYERWPQMGKSLEALRGYEGNQGLKDQFLENIHTGIHEWGKDYIAVIKGLRSADKELGTRWLQDIVDHIALEALKAMPSFS